jgi:hypothetical protein
MSNMSYCRFENTVADLRDCYQNMDEDLDDSETEKAARASLIRLCKRIAENYSEDDE